MAKSSIQYIEDLKVISIHIFQNSPFYRINYECLFCFNFRNDEGEFIHHHFDFIKSKYYCKKRK